LSFVAATILSPLRAALAARLYVQQSQIRPLRKVAELAATEVGGYAK